MISPVRALLLAILLIPGSLPALAQRKVRAEVRADRVNLRAQPSLDSEVLASLRKGEILEVLGEESSPGSKEAWSRVVLPTSVPVWIFSPGVDKAGIVKNDKIYFRAGPGRNYSALGHLRQGNSVSVLREFDGWLQISPPEGAVAFVASRFLVVPGGGKATNAPATPSSAPQPASEPSRAVPPPAPAPSDTPPPTPPASLESPPVVDPNFQSAATPAVIEPTAPPAILEPAPSQFALPQDGVPFRFDTTVTEPSSPAIETPPSSSVDPAEPDSTSSPKSPRPRLPLGSPRDLASRSAAAPKNFPVLGTHPDPGRPTADEASIEPRQVTREGTVARTFSPQAPSHFELRDGFYGEGVLDYLYIEPQDDLKKFLGRRVRVEGEEYRDSRWRTPVLKIKSIELAP
ncbi:MAG: SH3 domain-containing protein [Verrucomicrobiae bacterium]|nr:SH3 domain-containing protein [Verrucomicrobiae bacterium]